MIRTQTLIFACVAAMLVTGCARSQGSKEKSARLSAKSSAIASANAPTTRPARAVAPDQLAGAWRLTMPRADQKAASIKFTDAEHVTIEAGEHLSGDYVVQGNFLLILTHDDRLRPLAWRINSPDSLTVVRSPSLDGADLTGVTLVRAPGGDGDDEAVSIDLDEMP